MTAVPLAPIVLTNLNTPWEQVLHLGRPVRFRPRQLIAFSHDDENSGFYYVRKGRIRLSYVSVRGQEKVLFYVGKGTLFHDIPVLVESDYIFTCMEPTFAVYFRKKLISAVFAREYPEIMLNWVESTAHKSRNLFMQLCGSGLFDCFTNVCRALCSMVLHNNEQGRVIPQLTRQELAALLGIHRCSLHKSLARLYDEGIIGGYSRKELVVHDVERLQGYAQI